MKTKKMLLLAGIGALAYYLMKKKHGATETDEPGILQRFTNRIKDNLAQSLDDVAEEIPETSGMRTSSSRQ